METNFTLLRRMTNDSKELIMQVLNEIKSHSPEMINEMKKGLRLSDYESIRRSSHSLSSSADFIGNRSFKDCLRKIEDGAIQKESVNSLQKLIDECEKMFQELLVEIMAEEKNL